MSEETTPAEERTLSLLELAQQFSDARTAEKKATEARLALEERIIAATGFDLPEGQKTFEFSDACGRCKFVLKQPITTSIDDEAYGRMKASLPGALVRRLFRMKPALNVDEARDLQEKDPTTWAKVAVCVTRKPGKVSVALGELVVAGSAAPVEA